MLVSNEFLGSSSTLPSSEPLHLGNLKCFSLYFHWLQFNFFLMYSVVQIVGRGGGGGGGGGLNVT